MLSPPDPTEALGYAAAALVLATFSMRSLVALRSLAIASNVMFIAYSAAADVLPVLVLHGLLLPLNALRLHEAVRAAVPPKPGLRARARARRRPLAAAARRQPLLAAAAPRPRLRTTPRPGQTPRQAA